MSERCWNSDRYALHAVNEFSKWHEISTVRKKDKPTLIRWFMALIRKIQRVFNYDVIAIHTDSECGFGNDLFDMCTRLGIMLEITPPEHSEQNGLIESYNHVVTLRARAIRIEANLPKNLANKMYKSAIYILNRTPTEALQ
jgi:transposase InsO family protein